MLVAATTEMVNHEVLYRTEKIVGMSEAQKIIRCIKMFRKPNAHVNMPIKWSNIIIEALEKTNNNE